MPDSGESSWTDAYSGRERVRMVVELLDEPTTITDIAERADVAWGTAESELERLVEQNDARVDTRDGKTVYGPNPVQLLFDELLDLIHDHSREELETRLVERQSDLESLQGEYDVETLEALRERLTDDDLSAAEMREIRNGASTWSALETEIRLTKHALQLYDDVTELADGDDRPAFA
jgi:hypothetical protein